MRRDGKNGKNFTELEFPSVPEYNPNWPRCPPFSAFSVRRRIRRCAARRPRCGIPLKSNEAGSIQNLTFIWMLYCFLQENRPNGNSRFSRTFSFVASKFSARHKSHIPRSANGISKTNFTTQVMSPNCQTHVGPSRSATVSVHFQFSKLAHSKVSRVGVFFFNLLGILVRLRFHDRSVCGILSCGTFVRYCTEVTRH